MERQQLTNGVHDISNELYHSSEGISRSMLMHFKKSPYHYHMRFNNPDFIHPEPTAALIMGDLVHTMILEPHKADDRYIVRPPMDRRTKAGKIEYEKFMCSVSGRKVVDSEMIQQAVDMGVSVRDNNLAQLVLDGSLYEKSIYFTHLETGIQCKVRPDIWRQGMVGDLKTTKDASYHSFQRSCFNYGYFLQAGMIHEALKSIIIDLEAFVFIVVEKEPPYAVAVYQLSEECIDHGIEEFNRLMVELAECKARDSFPSYGFNTIELPVYANYQPFNGIQHDDE